MLVIARTAAAAAFLTRAFRDKTTRKIYWALGRRPAEDRCRAASTWRSPSGRTGRRTGARRSRGRQARGDLLPCHRQCRRQGELARAAAGHRAHAPIARALRRDRHADPRRPEIRRSRPPQLAGVPNANRLHLHARELSIPHPAGGKLRLTRRCRRICARAGSFSDFPATPRIRLPRWTCRDETILSARRHRAGGQGYGVALDGKPVKTPAKRDLIVPNAALAAAIAAEWNAQGDEVRPAQMPLTQIANTAIDRVTPQRAPVVRQIAKYAGTDLVCYRAERPPELAERRRCGNRWSIGQSSARRPARGHSRRNPGCAITGEPRRARRAVAKHDAFASRRCTLRLPHAGRW